MHVHDLHLGSLLLCMAGMFGILISFPTTWFLYNVVFQRPFFGMFNFMAAFVIVGIGVDDIFVFMDAWKQSVRDTPIRWNVWTMHIGARSTR